MVSSDSSFHFISWKYFDETLSRFEVTTIPLSRRVLIYSDFDRRGCVNKCLINLLKLFKRKICNKMALQVVRLAWESVFIHLPMFPIAGACLRLVRSKASTFKYFTSNIQSVKHNLQL